MGTNITTNIRLEGENEYKKAVKDINNNLKVLDSEMKLVKKQFADNANSITALTKQQEILNKKYDEQKKKVQEAEQMLNKAKQEYGENSDAVQKWQLELNNAKIALVSTENQLKENQEAMQKAKEELESLGQQAEETASRHLKTLNESLNDIKKSADNFENAGKKLTTGLTVPLTGLGALAVNTAKDFQTAMSQVQATMGIEKTSKEFEMLSEKAKEMGSTTAFSASEAAEGLNYLALAGYDASKACETLPIVLDVAAAGAMELGRASDLVTDAMSAMNISTDRVDEFADKLARTSQRSNTDISMLGEAIITLGGTAATLSDPLTEATTNLGLLANAGIKASEGGTHLRNIILALSAPSTTTAKALESLNLSAYDAEGKFRPLNETFEELKNKLSSLDEQTRNATLEQLFNKTDLAAVTALLNSTGEAYASLENEIINSTGAAEKMAETMQDNMQGAINQLKSALEGAGIGDIIMPSITNLIKNINVMVNNFNELDDTTKKNVVSAAAFAAAIGPILLVTGKLTNGIIGLINGCMNMVTALRTATVAQEGLNAAMKANIILAVASAVMTLVTAVAAYKLTRPIEETEKLSDEIRKLKIECDIFESSVNKTIDSYSEFARETEESIVKIEETGKQTKEWVDQLFELEKQIEKAGGAEKADDKIKQDFIITSQKLNAVNEEYAKSVDKNKFAIIGEKEELYKLADAYVEAAKKKAYAAQLEKAESSKLESRTQKTMAEEKAKTAEQLREEKKKQRVEIDKEIQFEESKLSQYRNAAGTNPGTSVYKDSINRYNEQKKIVEKLKEQKKELDADIKELAIQTNTYNAQIGKAEENIKLQEKNIETLKNSLGDYVPQSNNNTNGTASTAEENLENWKNTNKELELEYSRNNITEEEYQRKRYENAQKWLSKDEENKDKLIDEEISYNNFLKKLNKDKEKNAETSAKAQQKAIEKEQKATETAIKKEQKAQADADKEAEQARQKRLERLRNQYESGDTSIKDILVKELKDYQSTLEKWSNEEVSVTKEINVILGVKSEEETAKEEIDNYIKRAEKYIDNADFYNAWGNDTMPEALKRMKNNLETMLDNNAKLWAEYGDEVEAINRRIYTAQNEEIKKQADAINESIDKRAAEMKDKMSEIESYYNNMINKLQKQYTQEDRAENLAELRQQAKVYSKAVSVEGQEKYDDIIKQIQQIERQQEIEALQEQRDAEVAQYQEELNAIQAEFKANAEKYQNDSIALMESQQELLQKINDNMANALNLGSIIEPIVNMQRVDFATIADLIQKTNNTTVINNNGSTNINNRIYDNVDAKAVMKQFANIALSTGFF